MKKLPILNGEEEKTLMSEVLPQPPQPSPNGSPRQRTVQHMRKVLAAAAVAGIAVTSTRSNAGDAGTTDASIGDAGMDSVFIGHDPGPDAGGPPGDGSGGGFDSMLIGHDPVPDAGGPPGDSAGYDSMFVGHDPIGQSGGCSVGVPGRKGK